MRGDDIRPLAENFVIVQGAEAVAFYAHLRLGSVRVSREQFVTTGDVIGQVGNSGNSTMPHLHFHLMDNANVFEAAGVPCSFRSYERFDGHDWIRVADGIPGALERIRWITD